MPNDLIAFAKRMDQCWIERRFDDLADYLAPDVVIVAPGGAHRIEGVEAAIESYRAFMSRSLIRRFDASNYVVTARGDTAVIEYRWDMAWSDQGSDHEAIGRELLVLHRRNAGWRVMWRTQLPA